MPAELDLGAGRHHLRSGHGHRRQVAAPKLRQGRRQVGHPHGQRLGSANHISLGQVVVDQKSNEITAIPRPLEILEISGWLVAIDAMGCQAEITAKIVEGGTDYVLAVKGNQPALPAGIEAFFLDHFEDDFARVGAGRHEKAETGHGRTEVRSSLVCEAPDDLPDRARWRGLKAIGETIRDGKKASDVRYYFLSRRLGGKEFAAAVRSHWAIENSCHWSFDVAFGEDQCRIRKGHAEPTSASFAGRA